MNTRTTPEHLGRGAVLYSRQSTLEQVLEYTESQRCQYALAESVSHMGFSSVVIIDDERCAGTSSIPY